MEKFFSRPKIVKFLSSIGCDIADQKWWVRYIM